MVALFPKASSRPMAMTASMSRRACSGFLNGVCGGEFYIANLSAPPPHFRHTGKLDAELAKWIRTRLVSNPTCLLASTLDVFLIIDSQMDYSVIGGPPEVIEQFEKRFGGADGAAREVRRLRRPDARGQRHRRPEVGAGLSAEVVRLALTAAES